VTLVPASQARRIARRSSSTSPPHTPCEPAPNACRSESSRQSGRTGQRAQTAMACAAWSRTLATSQVMGNQASGSTRELAHRASRYTRPASSRSVRSRGSGRARRGLEAISPGCTSCPSASFIPPSSPRLRRPRIPSPVSRGSRPGRTGRWPRSGAPRTVPANSFNERTGCGEPARIIRTYTVAFRLREVFRQARHQVARRPGRIALEHARSVAAQTPRLGDVRGPRGGEANLMLTTGTQNLPEPLARVQAAYP
jgi:hypothetical protein